ncbi:MAG: hypothetical protein ACOYLE_01570 [Bacteroidales bacterium]
MARQDTRIESEGAEFLVLGNLLILGIPSYKTYTNMPGYDLIATNPDIGKSVRIQVKSRWRSNAPGFIIKNFDFDFLVVVRLNRGDKKGKSLIKEPEFFIFPRSVVENVPRSISWNKMNLKDIPNFESYKNQWNTIKITLN